MVLVAVIFGAGAPLRAQEVTGKGAGTIGGAVGGAEVVLAVESIIRVKPLWPYLVFPAVGAVGGGIGGYKLEKHSRGGAIALLLTSMVAVIPTVIAASSARSFDPADVGAKKGSEALVTGSSTADVSMESNMDESMLEIEERPEGLPDGTMGPPAPEGFDDSARSGETEVEVSAPDDEIDAPAAPADEAPYELNGEPESSAIDSSQSERLAHLSSGSLFHVNRQLRMGMGIPAVDVLPIQLPAPYANVDGMELRIPLLAVDLP